MNKGQLFSVDFLLAIAIVMLAVGVQLKLMQTHAFDAHQSYNQTELEAIGNTAVVLLLTNPTITCQVTNTTGAPLFHQPNCINTNITLTKSQLGIPSEYDYRITGITFTGSDARTPAATQENIYALDLNTLVNAGPIFKSTLNTCIQTGCPANRSRITLEVWKP